VQQKDKSIEINKWKHVFETKWALTKGRDVDPRERKP